MNCNCRIRELLSFARFYGLWCQLLGCKKRPFGLKERQKRGEEKELANLKFRNFRSKADADPSLRSG
jgi:hypothetical protein